jgi:hypothetical protein
LLLAGRIVGVSSVGLLSILDRTVGIALGFTHSATIVAGSGSSAIDP